MSRDNTILILSVYLNKKIIWIVLHVQAYELFGNPDFIKWRLWRESLHHLPYTKRKKSAIRIAKNMHKKIHNVEHGIVEFNSKTTIADCYGKEGQIIFTKEQLEPDVKCDMSDEEDWIKIAT